MGNVYQIQNPVTGNPYTVADGPVPGFVLAPERWRSQYAPYWQVSPFMPAPWTAFPLDPVEHDAKQEQFERVQGVMLTRKQWNDAGGSNADYKPFLSRYGQDYEYFLGIIDPIPADLAAGIAAHQQMWDAYGLGLAGCNGFVNRGADQAGRPEIVNLFFEDAPLPPPASKRSGRLKWRKEDVTPEALSNSAVWANQCVIDYQKALIDGGIYVPLLHPHAPGELQQRNAALAPKG